ncbi:hypothetical protein [Aquimarina sp. SS2-1]|uniref:hypothetical protein n=1 Tax=Aquimarina besae TaxID=3342247 RepID=UPI0036734C90
MKKMYKNPKKKYFLFILIVWIFGWSYDKITDPTEAIQYSSIQLDETNDSMVTDIDIDNENLDREKELLVGNKTRPYSYRRKARKQYQPIFQSESKKLNTIRR